MSSSSKTACRDHPRRCGENHCGLYLLTTLLGSPPQVRGKLYCFRGSTVKDRITPAGAGKTWLVSFALNMQIGSPPQVRGKRRDNDSVHRATRITPAGAGKTPVAYARAVRTWDHPRRCGENFRYWYFGAFSRRITPAGAGKTGSTKLTFPAF